MELKKRIHTLTPESAKQWGKMNSSQMLRHCRKIIDISCGDIILPKIHPLLKVIGIITKHEMYIFGNGIPRSMPTFKEVVVTERCNFEKSKVELIEALDRCVEKARCKQLLYEHALFGRMSSKRWGFMHYKHLNHHLKQFGV